MWSGEENRSQVRRYVLLLHFTYNNVYLCKVRKLHANTYSCTYSYAHISHTYIRKHTQKNQITSKQTKGNPLVGYAYMNTRRHKNTNCLTHKSTSTPHPPFSLRSSPLPLPHNQDIVGLCGSPSWWPSRSSRRMLTVINVRR